MLDVFSTYSGWVQRLRALAELLDTPTATLGPGSRQKVTDALDAVRALRHGPLRGQPTGPRPDSVWATLLALDVPGGATAAEVATATGLAEKAVRLRLFALTEWGLVVRLGGGQGLGPTTRHGLPEHSRLLLAQLADPGRIADPAHQTALERFAAVLGRSAGLRPEQRGTQELREALDGVRALPDGPLATTRTSVPADSLWATLEAVAAAAGVAADDLAERTGVLTLPAMRHRLHVLADWGLLDVRRGARGRKIYTVRAVTRLLLADLMDPAAIPSPAYRDAVEALAPLLVRNANLLPDSPWTEPLARAVAAVLELRPAPYVPVDSLWGALRALAARGPTTAVALADAQGISEAGVVGRLADLHTWGLVERALDWGGTGGAPQVVHTATATGRRLLAELADPAAVEDGERRALAEDLVGWFSVPTTVVSSAAREAVRAGVDAIAAQPAGPLAPSAAHAPSGSLRAMLDVLAAAPEGWTEAEVIEVTGVERSVVRLRLAAFLDWGLVERAPRRGARGYRYRLAPAARRLLAELDRPETHHGERRPLAVLALRLAGAERLEPGRAPTLRTAEILQAVRDMPDSPLPARGRPAPSNSVRAMLEVLARNPDGLTVTELAALLAGTEPSAVRMRLQVLVGWGYVWQARDTRPGANRRDLAYRLPGETQHLLELLAAAPLQPVTRHQQALHDLVVALDTPTRLQPGHASTTAVARALDAVRALPRSPLPARGPPASPNSVRGTLDAIGAAGGATAIELAERAGTSTPPMHQRLRALTRLGLVEPRRDGARTVHVLAPGTPALLAALDAAPLDPRTTTEQALRVVASVLNRPVSLAPDSDGHAELSTALAQAHAAEQTGVHRAGQQRRSQGRSQDP